MSTQRHKTPSSSTSLADKIHHFILSLRQTINLLLTQEMENVFITNITEENLLKQRYYCLVLDRQQLVLAEKNQVKKVHFCLDFEAGVLTLNHKQVDINVFQKVMPRIQKIIADIHCQKARIYEKK
ncbi:MAG: hypothetical protein AB7F28_03830 [Candidatus Margulisiibacteriota bacterium]